MIKTFYQDDIINRLGAIITYGLSKGYSYRTIEERIVSSSLINALENNEYDIESKIYEVVESTYRISLIDKNIDISFKGLFIAESYFRLFINFHKSFEYLFLYWPLSDFISRYSIYHEMDFSNLRNDFVLRIKEITLLRKLSQDRQIKLVEISKLTGINENTIDKYSRDDKYLFGASFENIYKLAKLFHVKDNIFISNLGVYLDNNIYLSEKRNEDYRNYLGLSFANYYDHTINEKDFSYDREHHYFLSNGGIKLIAVVDTIDNLTISKLNEVVDSNTYLILIPYGFFGDETNFKELKELNTLDTFVLANDFTYIVKKGLKKERFDSIDKALVTRAMEKFSTL